MSRLLLALLLIVALWFGLKDWSYRMLLSQGSPAMAPAPDYGTRDAWLLHPIELPAAVWDSGWAVDVFFVPAPGAAPLGHGMIAAADPAMQDDVIRASAEMLDSLGAAGPVFAPAYRLASPASAANGLTAESLEDIRVAFSDYLDARNNGRAVLIATAPGMAAPVAQAIAPRLDDDLLLAERVAGHVAFVTRDTPQALACSPAPGLDCPLLVKVSAQRGWSGLVAPRLMRQPVAYRLADPEETSAQIAAHTAAVLAWLNDNAPMLAEPLEGFDSIEVAPIRRPGEIAVEEAGQ